ncbi:hypothetical protein [Phaeobacter sp. J2-8]|uniref:hypothetical protein n=1 Tax=Phaeobacter sp. J2-8 TaxID=2931394 RepID=UPI001FD5F792|nr:hypothetical protein [Phaeobacter sp. J2-8]MCJ7872786.1 hypothetical protein [Phaeobacter sp. J2-8]
MSNQTHIPDVADFDGRAVPLGRVWNADVAGEGLTHKINDTVVISAAGFGALRNRVRLSTECPEWAFGISHLMRNLAHRNLI